MTILDRIVTDVRDNLSVRKREVSLNDLREKNESPSSTKDFLAALKEPGIGIIAEIKQRSPSKGLLRKPFRIHELSKSFSNGQPDAISVLTEPDHFGGSLCDLRSVSIFTGVPVLRKDFIIDPYQLYEARAHGADAVLLIAAILDSHQLADLLDVAKMLDLDCLVEVHDPMELDKIDFDQISILGVNNRNLHTFEVDIEHSLRVFELVEPSITKVSESGLRSPKDIAYLSQHGIDAVLIGETFMRSDDPGLALRTLRGEVESLLPTDES